MADLTAQFFDFLFHDPVTLVVGILIALAFGVGLYANRTGTYGPMRNYIPTFMTSLGILGTFFGIVLGLLQFDPNHVDASLPSLLSGLKTAFVTSIFGMTGTILFKVWTLPKNEGVSPQEAREQSLAEALLKNAAEQREALERLVAAVGSEREKALAAQLSELKEEMCRNDQKRLELLEKIVTELGVESGGGVHSALVTVHKTMEQIHEKEREDFNAFSASLSKQMSDCLATLSNAATGQIVDALSQVIQDFNAKLTDQFGDNFKALNKAVERLVEWQENYKDHIEAMEQRVQAAASSLERVNEAVGQISEKTDRIAPAMRELEDVVGVLHQQIDTLKLTLETLSDVRRGAIEAVPEIKRTFDSMAESMKRSVTDTTDVIDESLRKMTDSRETFVEGLEEMTAMMKENAERVLNETHTQVESLARFTHEQTQAQLNKLDQDLVNELNRVLQELGNALATITKGLLNQYEARGRDNVV